MYPNAIFGANPLLFDTNSCLPRLQCVTFFVEREVISTETVISPCEIHIRGIHIHNDGTLILDAGGGVILDGAVQLEVGSGIILR